MRKIYKGILLEIRLKPFRFRLEKYYEPLKAEPKVPRTPEKDEVVQWAVELSDYELVDVINATIRERGYGGPFPYIRIPGDSEFDWVLSWSRDLVMPRAVEVKTSDSPGLAMEKA